MNICKFFSGRQSAHSEILRMKLSVSCAGVLILRRGEKSSRHPFRQSARNCFKNSTDSLIKNEKEPCRLMKSLLSMYRQDFRRMALALGHFQAARFLNAGDIKNLVLNGFDVPVFPQCFSGYFKGWESVSSFPCYRLFMSFEEIIFSFFRVDFHPVDVIKHVLFPFGFRPSGLDCSPAFDFLKMQTGGLSICIRPELLRPVISTHPKKRMQWNVE